MIRHANRESSKPNRKAPDRNHKQQTPMTTRSIPRAIQLLIQLATRALAGLLGIGATVDVQQNTAAKTSADLYDLTGEPGAGPNAGKQGQLNEKRAAVTAAETARRGAIAAGCKFCGDAVDSLKSHLGRRWNPQWQAVGFSQGSLELPRHPLALLLQLRNYFRAHAAHEVTAKGITAAQADALATALQQAEHDLDLAKSARKTASEARDEAVRKLASRLTGLRTELDQLLDDDDPRWGEFGFGRPIDGGIPAAVDGLTLRAGGAPGEIIAEWAPSSGAINYRVSRRISGVDGDPVEIGLVAEPLTIISGLPAGSTVTVSVTARNNDGETQPVSAQIVV
jgi:hypothetical protein